MGQTHNQCSKLKFFILMPKSEKFPVFCVYRNRIKGLSEVNRFEKKIPHGVNCRLQSFHFKILFFYVFPIVSFEAQNDLAIFLRSNENVRNKFIEFSLRNWFNDFTF